MMTWVCFTSWVLFSKFQRVFNDKNARDVSGLPFHGGAGGGLFHLRLLWFQR